MANQFTDAAKRALNGALTAAEELGSNYIGSEHILLGLLIAEDSAGAKILDGRGVTKEKLYEILDGEGQTGGGAYGLSAGDMTPRTKRIIERSAYEATNLGQSYIGSEHLLLALIKESDSVAVKLLSALGVSVREIYSDILAYLKGSGEKESIGSEEGDPREDGKESGGKFLQKYGRDLTRAAKDGKLDPIIGREEETERVIQILSRRTKNNPCLIGEPGVGKTAVVEGLAIRIAEHRVPENLLKKRIVTLELSGMIAGAKYRGEFEERMKGIMNEVKKDPNVILFIDEIHTIVGAGAAEGAVDAANILKPALARGDLQVIGATTIAEYRKYIEKDAALERRFLSVMVGEPSQAETVEILRGLRDKYEAHHKVKITDDAIDAAVKLSARYIGDRYLPDKAIDLIDEAASKLRIDNFTAPPAVRELEERLRAVTAEKEEAIKSQNFEKAAGLRDEEASLKKQRNEAGASWDKRKKSADLRIGSEEIADIVTSWTGIPVKKLANEEGQKLLHLEETLKARVIGQDPAVEAVAKAIRRGRLGLKDPNRPMGSFIFLGPTGVGKTELAKALAAALFGEEKAMIRIDMSEYMEKHSVSKLIGSPPGYVGFEDGGQLTEKIRRRPYSVVLFDEIEKAHPDVFNILLQILDDGILTDSKGRTVDFKNALIIMTSNVGASALTERSKTLGFTAENKDNENMKEKVMGHLRESFRPEFLNRVDDIIVFSRLAESEVKKIAALMLDEIGARIEKLGFKIEFGESVVDFVSKEGFDPLYGARPLRRAIQSKVEDAFATAMLSGAFDPPCTVSAEAAEGEIVFEKVESASPTGTAER